MASITGTLPAKIGARPEWACPDRPGNGTLPLMEIALVKAAGPGDRDRGVKRLEQRWVVVPPGGTLRLSWPLPPDCFAEAVP